jgi:phosphoglycolate phosphatase
MSSALRTVLFDLDGTLADTAPDLAFALNSVLEAEGHPILPLELIRPAVSQGTRSLLKLGFDIAPDAPSFEPLRQRLLTIYRSNLTRETRLFPGMTELLSEIERRGMNWGVVTNKPAFLTDPLLAQLNLAHRAACIVSGDTTGNAKPHPEPMLYACKQAGSSVSQCLFVGDSRCDIEAGGKAGMKTLVALFGYVPVEENLDDWNADGMISHPLAVLDWIDNHA